MCMEERISGRLIWTYFVSQASVMQRGSRNLLSGPQIGQKRRGCYSKYGKVHEQPLPEIGPHKSFDVLVVCCNEANSSYLILTEVLRSQTKENKKIITYQNPLDA